MRGRRLTVLPGGGWDAGDGDVAAHGCSLGLVCLLRYLNGLSMSRGTRSSTIPYTQPGLDLYHFIPWLHVDPSFPSLHIHWLPPRPHGSLVVYPANAAQGFSHPVVSNSGLAESCIHYICHNPSDVLPGHLSLAVEGER